MGKGLVLGLTATTSMILIGVGSALTGALALKGFQIMAQRPKIQVDPSGRPL